MPEKTRKIREIQEKEKKPTLSKKLLAVSIALATIIILGTTLYQLWRNPQNEVKFSLNAAIIDQLSEDFYNKTFVESITAMLKKYDFTVTYYNYTQTKVEFFRDKLMKGNYGIIILRLHSALREDGSAVDFFTSEQFDPEKYTKEMDEDLLVRGILNYSGNVREYFAFTPTFVEKLEGTFPNSIIIAMGCHGLNQNVKQQMAKVFFDKGATVYIGWSSQVSVTHSDGEILQLIKRLLNENKTIEDAVKKASQDQEYGAFLDFYPKSSGSLKISDLIKKA